MKRILLISLFAVMTSSLFGQVSKEDYLTLKEIYNALGGKHWSNSSGWDFSGSEADVKAYNKSDGTGWWGITEISKGRVSKLELIENNLTGEMPAALSKLTVARTVNLSKNNISGVMPNDIGNMERITVFDVSNNKISGDIPASIVSIGKNGYSRKQSEGKSGTDIKILLYNNRLTGELPADICSMPILHKEARTISLNLANNQLMGEVPSCLSDIETLTTLKLEKNNFTGTVPQRK